MAERTRGLTAEQRLAELVRDRKRLRRARLMRELAGPRWRRMVSITPALFVREGTLHVRYFNAPREAVIDALKETAVFALDTAMRLSRGYGFIACHDIHAYLLSAAVLDRISASGLIACEDAADKILVRPFAGPPRLFVSVVSELPPSRLLPTNHRVVTRDRLARELIGAVGARADLFALLERDDGV